MISRRRLLLSSTAFALLRPFARLHTARADTLAFDPVFVLAHKCQGCYPNNDPLKWLPRMDGGRLVLSTPLSSLAGYEDSVTVVAGARVPNFEGRDWHHSAGAQYHGTRVEGDTDTYSPSGESVDQFVARSWGTDVKVTDACRHAGYTERKSGQYVSWRMTPDGARRQPPARGLSATFSLVIGDRLAGTEGLSREAMERRLRQGRSLLDAHGAEIARLRGELSGDLGARLEAHVEGYREFERATFQTEEPTSRCDEAGIESAWRSGDPSANEPGQDWIWRRAKLYAEMIAFAAACGIGRSFVYGFVDDDSGALTPPDWQADQKPEPFRGTDSGSALVTHPAGRPSRFVENGGEGGNRTYHFGFWHNLGRTQNHDQIEDYIFRYSVGYLVKQLDARGVLDASLVLYGTTMSFDHSNADQSYVWIGGAGGRHRGGRVLPFGRFGSGDSTTNNQVLTSTCRMLGLPRDHFGDRDFGTGGVPGVDV
jgi:hypothetical protein